VVLASGHRSFIGREAELARLGDLLGEAAGGAGRTVIIAGEAGIGKSRLLGRFSQVAAPGARFLEGACLQSADDGVPYAPFVEILRELIVGTAPERLPALLGPARSELARLVPDLITRAADVPFPSAPDRAAQGRLFELILGVFERLARTGPLVVTIEDVHWADRSTRELLGFLVRALRDDPVLILLALRTDEEGAATGNLAFVAELEREEQVERIDLPRFGWDEVAAQLAALRDGPPEPASVDQLLARSDGNPFYVEELVLSDAELAGDLPAVLRDVVAARIALISGPARDVLRAAAVAGRRVDDELLAAVLDLPVRSLADALREAVESGILARGVFRDGPGIGFRHAIFQETVSGDLFTGERVALHGAFAAALESRAGATSVQGGPGPSPAEIALHWDAARRPERAFAPTVQAAVAAEHVYAFGEAHRLWARADVIAKSAPSVLESSGITRDSILEHAADAAVLAGSYREAVALGERAIRAVVGEPDPARSGHLQDRLRWYLWEAGDRRAAAGAVEAALRLIPADPPSVGRARALAQHAGIQLYAGEFEAATREATEAIAVARQADAPGEEALALGVLGWSLAVLGDPSAGIARLREGQDIAQRIESVEGMALAALNLASLLDRIGLSEESLQAAAAGYATTERLGVARTYGGLLLGFRAKAEFLLGRWDEADASTALGLRRGTTDRAELWLATNRARLLTARGAHDEAAALLALAQGIEDRLGSTEFASSILAIQTELAAWQGRLADVRRAAVKGIELAAKPGPPDPSLAWMAATVLRAEADAASSIRSRGTDAERAASVAVQEQIDKATDSAATTRELLAGSARGRALLALLRAERARLAGHDDPAAWAAVARGWIEAGRPYPAAYGRYREAAAILAGRGVRSDAAAALNAAASTALELGAGPLLALARILAGQARIALGDPIATGTTGINRDGVGGTEAALGLTARESEVLRLVAGGWTNQQIADALFITRKTASVHVSNILGKLGVEHRGAAAAAAHRLGLGTDAPLPPDGAPTG